MNIAVHYAGKTLVLPLDQAAELHAELDKVFGGEPPARRLPEPTYSYKPNGTKYHVPSHLKHRCEVDL